MNIKKLVSSLLVAFIFTLSLAATTISAASGKTIEGMLGHSAPVGTIAKANNVYSDHIAANVIDGDIKTRWNASLSKAEIELVFPKAIELNFVQFATNATPPVSVQYTIFGLLNNQWVKVSEPTTLLLEGFNSINPPVAIKKGTYEGIKIAVDGKTSWAAINELTFGNAESITLNAQAGDSTVNLNWNPIAGTEKYVIKYGTEPGKYTESITVTKDVYDNFPVQNLINGTTYYFQVSSIVKEKEFIISNEASATPVKKEEESKPEEPKPEEPKPEEPKPEEPTDPEESPGARAILVVTMINGLEKEYDLPMKDIQAFLNWYDARDKGVSTAKSKFLINKYDNNKGPFRSRVDYVIFNNILMFEVNEYNEKI
ncbi:fibronectin type III domain-containing protein [Paenibacillus agilis]|uniref:fibronectin type III domain-containing protein n=1 Tax=Paenibacillus agilis TaxID=3020863 RepID=UPI001649DEF1|nr:fibronectin type III domain-containing protein [Paenibacillus agilis]